MAAASAPFRPTGILGTSGCETLTLTSSEAGLAVPKSGLARPQWLLAFAKSCDGDCKCARPSFLATGTHRRTQMLLYTSRVVPAARGQRVGHCTLRVSLCRGSERLQATL
eukprot:scaffold158_cov388-Prasinococcus_capsulatus_cf.AAC.8